MKVTAKHNDISKTIVMTIAARCAGVIRAAIIALACISMESFAAAAEPLSPLPQSEVSQGELRGMFINKGDDTPLVLIVPGSGPTDLNGNNGGDISSDSYKLLAQGLAARGISSVRVDKRGMYSSARAGDPNKVTVDIYAQDYRQWAAKMSQDTGRHCIYLLGHSEGALMVSAAAAQSRHVCGLILAAGIGRPLGDVLRQQLRGNPANKRILKQAFDAIDRLEAGQKVDTKPLHSGLKALFNAQVQGLFISSMAVDPADMARQANKPTLILQGTRDLQVTLEDAQLLENASGGYLVVIDKMNHVLKEASKNRRRNYKTYSQPDRPLSTGLIDAIAIFIEAFEAQ